MFCHHATHPVQPRSPQSYLVSIITVRVPCLLLTVCCSVCKELFFVFVFLTVQPVKITWNSASNLLVVPTVKNWLNHPHKLAGTEGTANCGTAELLPTDHQNYLLLGGCWWGKWLLDLPKGRHTSSLACACGTCPLQGALLFLKSPEKLRNGRRTRLPQKAAQPVISTPEGGCSFYLVLMCISWTTPLPSRARIWSSFSCHDIKMPNFKAVEVST